MFKGLLTEPGLAAPCAAGRVLVGADGAAVRAGPGRRPWSLQLGQNSDLGQVVVDGIGTVARQDGTQQVTLDGWPLYRHLNGVVPGQTTGQGVNRAWYAVAPDGSKAGAGHH